MLKLYIKRLARTASVLTLFLFSSSVFAQTSLFVNEIMASNNHTIADVTGAYEDWFEIYNPNDVVIDLAGYYLSDKTSSPKKYKMPAGNAETRIQPHGYLIIWASEKPERGPLHVAFALSASGENVVITAPDGSLVDAVTFGVQNTDISYGRYPDGSSTWTEFIGSTPGANNSGGTTQLPKLAAPSFSVPGGFKSATFQLSITHPDPTVRIRYTTDGSEPILSDQPTAWKYKNGYGGIQRTDQGLLTERNQSYDYLGSFPISDRSPAANRLSVKSSTSFTEPSYFPESPVYKGTVIRARAFKTGSLPSEIITRTYFVSPLGANKYSMPVISVVSDERSFFDYSTGIYTAGRQYDRSLDDNSLTNGNCTFSNFTMDGGDWERRGSFELFEHGNAVFNQENIGIRTHGYCSRVSPQKSLRIYSDTEFNYNFFPGQKSNPKRLLLRTRGNEPSPTSEIKDLFCQKLVEFLPFDSQSAKPAVIFLNGEYWGFQSIRERYDRYYLEGKYKVANDNMDLIQLVLGKPAPGNYEVEEGDEVAYKELISFVADNAMDDPANYEKLKTLIDIDNYTDYQIAELIIDNPDWPYQNIRLWRTKVPNQRLGSPYGDDGRWRFMFFDTDYAFNYGPSSNSFANEIANQGTFALLFKKLLMNADYRRLITSRIADLLNTHFTSERSNTLLNDLKNTFEPLMQENIDRWKEKPSKTSNWTAPQSMSEWNTAVTNIKNFVTNRPAGFRNAVRTQLGADLADVSLTVYLSDPALGYVRVNAIDILPTTPGIPENPYPWTGIYFKSIPVQLTAIPKPDGFFVQWQGPNGFSSNQATITITPGSDPLGYFALFQKRPVLSNLAINGQTLNPGFVPSTTDYNVTVPTSQQTVTLTPTFGPRASRVSYTGGGGLNVPIADGATSAPLNIAPGVNTISLRVFDFDGFGAKFYTIIVNRPMNAPGNTFNFSGTKTQTNAIQFVRIDKRIETPNFTLEAWILTSENSATGTQGYMATSLFNSDKAGDANDFTMGILNNKISFFDGSVNQTTLGATVVTDGRWHHVAVVREANVAVRIYIDGRLDKENTTGAGRATLNENSYIALGGNPGYAPSSFQGLMDEARIWTSLRNANDIQQNMYSVIPSGTTNLKVYYDFDMGIYDESSIVPDHSGNQYDGTMGNFNLARIPRAESYAMVVPVSQEATGISTTEFTANWTAPGVGVAEKYFLDVSTSINFPAGSFLSGFEALQVNGTSQKVTWATPGGRIAASDLYYRVRADKSSVAGQGAFSATTTVSLSPMPVNLISFSCKKTEEAVMLEWNVNAETAFDRYEIERSFDAKSFDKIGWVKADASGKTETTSYFYSDNNFAPTFSILYYRLKMIDTDGSFAYSKIASVRNDVTVLLGQIYPNPVSGKKMFIDINLHDSETWQMATFSSAGIQYNTSKLVLLKGKNRVPLPVDNLKTGLYIVTFRNSLQQEFARKVVVE